MKYKDRSTQPKKAAVRALHGLLWLGLLLAYFGGASAIADEARPDRIKIEYVPPTNPQQQGTYEMLKKRGVLEKLQQVFAPFKLPIDLVIKTANCGESNAWYERPHMKPAITICYEYIEDIRVPKATTAAGITPTDAIIGQFFYVATHEFGHAMFDILDVPIFGRLEDAADQFAAYIMLQFGEGQARRLMGGAAFTYSEDIRKDEFNVSLKRFSDSHGSPQERFFNLVCLAYGADQKVFADAVEKGYLPEARARRCKREFGEVAFAFKHLIRPHLDTEMAKQVLETDWLPKQDVKSALQQ